MKKGDTNLATLSLSIRWKTMWQCLLFFQKEVCSLWPIVGVGGPTTLYRNICDEAHCSQTSYYCMSNSHVSHFSILSFTLNSLIFSSDLSFNPQETWHSIPTSMLIYSSSDLSFNPHETWHSIPISTLIYSSSDLSFNPHETWHSIPISTLIYSLSDLSFNPHMTWHSMIQSLPVLTYSVFLIRSAI